jgi:hypothetical protein
MAIYNAQSAKYNNEIKNTLLQLISYKNFTFPTLSFQIIFKIKLQHTN